MNQRFENISIQALATCVPKNVVRNDEFVSLLSPKEISSFEKTVGIKERRWVDSNVTASDLGFKSAELLFSIEEGIKKRVKALIFLSQTPDFKIPFTSNILQSRLDLNKNTLCLDINAGCAGFIQGLSVAFSITQTLNSDDLVLLVISETLSKILSPLDRSTTMLFGDAGSALLIGRTAHKTNTYFNFFSDGSNYDSIIIPDGGFRNMVSKDSFFVDLNRSNLNLHMNGSKVFDFTLREIAPSILEILGHFEIDINSIDYLLLHQSNKFILKQIALKLGIPFEKVLINIENFGNTSGVSIPLLINSFKDKFKESNSVLFSGYGSGLNWANCLTDISNTLVLELIEY